MKERQTSGLKKKATANETLSEIATTIGMLWMNSPTLSLKVNRVGRNAAMMVRVATCTGTRISRAQCAAAKSSDLQRSSKST